MHVSAIRKALHAQPFQPFRLRLADGREFPVPHPDFVAISERTVVVIDPADEGATVLEPVLIISLEGLKGSQATGNQSGSPGTT